MPRRPRTVIAGVAHHVTQRGNNRQTVFFSPEDYFRYLELLARHAAHCGVRILGYCLMPNHVHLVGLPLRADSLARTLGRTHSEYSLAVNRAAGRSGHLWQNRFFSCPLDEKHAVRAMRYVDSNPVRARLAPAAWEWSWSSARAHTVDGASDGVLDSHWKEYFGRWDYGEWAEILSAGATGGEGDDVRRATRTGEPLGSREFVTALERQMGRRLRVWERGRPKSKAQSPEEASAQGCLF